MNRVVYCIKLKKEAGGLFIPPLPGEKGKWIYENISQQAWSDWQNHQTRLINEKKLNLLDIKDRNYINEQMDKYLAGEVYDQVEGFKEK